MDFDRRNNDLRFVVEWLFMDWLFVVTLSLSKSELEVNDSMLQSSMVPFDASITETELD